MELQGKRYLYSVPEKAGSEHLTFLQKWEHFRLSMMEMQK